MVIDTTATLALTFCLVRHTLHIPKVVIRPHQRDVLWHLKPSIIDVERLLIGHKNLWNQCGTLFLMRLQNLTLVCHHLFQRASPHLRVGRTLHRLIVQSTHTHRVDIVILRCLSNTIVQFLPDGLLVRQVVPLAIPFLTPFRRSGIVEQQRLTMTGGNHDAPLCRLHLTLRMAIESPCTSVHGRSQHIGLQTQQQFTHLIISLRTNILQFSFEVPLCPRLQAPVLIVEEDTTILHRRFLRCIVLFIVQRSLLLHRHIGKPIPRAHTYPFTHMERTIRCTPRITAHHIESLALRHNLELFPSTTNVLHTHFVSKFQMLQPLYSGNHHQLFACVEVKRQMRIRIQTRTHSRTNTRHPFHILCEHIRHLLHQSRIVFHQHHTALLQIDSNSRHETAKYDQ